VKHVFAVVDIVDIVDMNQNRKRKQEQTEVGNTRAKGNHDSSLQDQGNNALVIKKGGS